VSVPREDSSGVPNSPEFSALAFPNPFNDQTKVSFQIPVQGDLTLQLYDVTGRELRTFSLRQVAASEQSILIRGKNLPSGILFLHATLESLNQTYKFTTSINRIN